MSNRSNTRLQDFTCRQLLKFRATVAHFFKSSSLVVPSIFLAGLLAFSINAEAAKPYRYTVTVFVDGRKEGMRIPWTSRDTVQKTILDHVDEMIGQGRYKEGNCFVFDVRSPKYGDAAYPPFKIYGYMNQNNLITLHNSIVPECE